jgi:nitrite reductase/ring-hydroxylating ferredoxin subunit
MTGRFPFPGLPAGWYAVAVGSEVRPGKLLSRHYFGRDLIVFRTAAGAVRVADAFCPHMGAHLGRVGKIEGEFLRCGFHGFQYDASGHCVATPYDGPPPARARLRFWEVRERNGLILVWFDPLDRAPSWEVPVLEDASWSGIRWRRFRIATHPQETTENSVDFGHFTQIHGFVDGAITRGLQIEGSFLSAAYRAFRPMGVPGLPRWKMPVDYFVNVWGLGYSQVDVDIHPLHIRARVWVLPVPIDEENIDLVIGCSVPGAKLPIAPLLRFIVHRIVCKEVEQDLDVWEYKAYHQTPALAKGDGPIAEYRRYAEQFYAPPAHPARRA